MGTDHHEMTHFPFTTTSIAYFTYYTYNGHELVGSACQSQEDAEDWLKRRGHVLGVNARIEKKTIVTKCHKRV
jgi:hypothetical protein